MIGLDTSILIRYLTQDDRRQSAVANFILERLTETEPGFVSLVTVAETAWVLESNYGGARTEVVDAIEGLISQDTIVVEAYEQVIRSIEEVRDRNVHFADALIGQLALRAGCSATLTFDSRAARLPAFQLAT